jgi:zinc protease
VTNMVWYRVGAADEPPAQSGIAHFLEHLMFKGTEKIEPGLFSKIVARNGGEDNAFTNHDVTAYFQRVAKERLPMVMEMEADRMANLRLAENDVVTERKVIIEERKSRVDNDPNSILQEQMMAALYQSHPYGIPVIGWEHEILTLDRDDAMEYYERFYAPNNAIVVIAGDVVPDEVKKLADETFGKLKPSARIGVRERPQEPKHYAPVRVDLSDPRAGRTIVQRYYLAPSVSTADEGEAEALTLLMKIVAGGSTGRLYRKLVAEDKIAASAGGWYSDSGLDGGRIGVYAVASGDSAAPAELEKGIDAVISEIVANGVTPEELERARANEIADFVYATDSQGALARQYGWRLAMGQSLEEIDQWTERLKKVDAAAIQRVAAKHLLLKNSVTGVLTPTVADAANTKKPGHDGKPRS